MNQWWNGLSAIQQLFYCCAIPATIILVIQTLLTIIGLGDNFDSDADIDVDSDVDVDFDGDIETDFDTDFDAIDDFNGDVAVADQIESTASLKFFSIRGIIAFFTLFGWVGLVLSESVNNLFVIFLISTISGFLGMLIIAVMFYGITKLQSSGNIRLKNAIGLTGEVYIPIPPNRSGKGKVQITIQERFSEIYAMTDNKKTLSTGCIIRVVDVIDINTLLVEKTK